MKGLNKRLGILAIFVIFSLSTAYSQFLATGKVSDEKGNPIIGAAVVAKGTFRGTITDANGDFSLQIPENSATLEISYLGYATKSVAVNSSETSMNVSLEDKATIMDEVIVSGLASTIKRSNAANAVAAIGSKELAGVTVQQTLDGALQGKLPGANINSNSGAPGGGISIKLRGVTTLTGNSQPLFIIDGVYIDNSSVPGGLNSLSLAYRDGRTSGDQDNPSNRIADIDPEDIESIEILKGASTAAIYGSRAGAGVVIIKTKRGKMGKTQIDLSQSVGYNSAIKLLGVRQWDETKAKTHFGDPGVAAFKTGKLYDYEDELYGNNGLLSTTRLNFSGGDDKTKFFAGATYKNDEGIVKNTGYEKLSFRLNLDRKLSKFMDISLNSNYIRSSADRGFFNNDNSSATMGVSLVSTPAFAELHADANGNYPNNPFAPSNFLQTGALMTNNESINRFITGGGITTHLYTGNKQSLNFIVRGGIDFYVLEGTILAPSTLQWQKNGNGTNGASIINSTSNTNKNVGAFLVHDYAMSNKMNFKTQVGLTAENFDQNTIINKSNFLIGSQTGLNQAGSKDVVQNKTIQKDRGFFAQEEVNWNDNIIVTLGMRADKSSNNGDANKLYYYPKASIAANVVSIAGIKNNSLSDLKLRIAYGQSGNFPRFGSIYTPLNAITIAGNTGSIVGVALGNKNLGPERQTETEFGFDVGLLKNKLLFDFTYYLKNIKDLVLPVAIPRSSGFTSQWLNAAELNNNGIELGLAYEVVNTSSFVWNTRVGFWKNKAKIKNLKVPAYNEGGFAPILGVFRIEEGQSPTQIVGTATKEEGANASGLKVWGDAEPKFNLSFSNGISFGRFELNALLHWKEGGSNINLTTLLSDLSGTSPDYDEKNLDPAGKLNNGDYRVSQLGTSAKVFVEESSYVRLREIGLTYRIPTKFCKSLSGLRIGVSGRNLLNFFSYNSYDPEVSNFGIRAISSSIEVTPFPSSKSLLFTLGASF